MANADNLQSPSYFMTKVSLVNVESREISVIGRSGAEVNVRTQVVPSLLARFALAAVVLRFNGHGIAGFQMGHSRADPC